MRLNLSYQGRVKVWDFPGWARSTIIVIILVAIWQLYVSFGNVNPLLVSSPLATANALLEDLKNGQLPAAAWNSLQNLLIGMVISAVIGFALASFSTFSRIGHDLLVVLTAIFNPLPGVAVLPLAMLWFGLTPNAIIFVVVQSAIWPIAASTDMGFRTISSTTRMVALNLGLSRRRMVFDVFLPAALPHILSGLRLAWAFGWRTVVAGEIIFGVTGSAAGLGWYINNARYFLNVPPMFAGLVAISLLGILVDTLFLLFERFTIVRWGMKHTYT